VKHHDHRGPGAGGGAEPANADRSLGLRHPPVTISWLPFRRRPWGTALPRLRARGRGHVLVVERSQPSRLLGLIRREDIIRAAYIALARRAELQHWARRIQLRTIDGTEFVKILVSEGDRTNGQSVQDITKSMPSNCILVSIRRGGRLLILHGDTMVHAGDSVPAFAESRRVEELRRCPSIAVRPKED
jgi:chloride channel protein, CIC family